MENKYLLGSEKDFYNFVDNLSEKDKIGIITHTDLDGLVSAVFMKDIIESKKLKVNFVNFLDLNAGVLSAFAKKKKFDKLFLTDWCADNFPEELAILRKKGKVFVIDHHPVNNSLEDKSNILKTETADCSSYCIYNLAKKYDDIKDSEWLVCPAMIFDYSFQKDENFNFIKSFYPQITKENLWDSEPAITGKIISGAMIYYSSNLKKVFNKVLKKNLDSLKPADLKLDKEFDKWTEKYKNDSEYFSEKKLHFYYGSPKHRLNSAIVSKLSNNEYPQDTLVFVSNIIDNKKLVVVSARNQTGKVNLNSLLKKCTEGFEDSSAGGHIKSSGASFPKKYLNDFKENLLKEL